MLTQKTWKAETVLRLALGVVICICAGSLVLSGLHYFQARGFAFSWFLLVAVAGLACLGVTLARLWNPWRSDKLFSPLLIFLMWLYAGLTLTFLAEKMAGPIDAQPGKVLVSMLSFQGAALFLIRHFLREHQIDWAEAFGFKNRMLFAVLIGIIVGCVFLPVGQGLQWLSIFVMEHLPHPVKPQEQEAIQAMRSAVFWLDRGALGATAIVVAPLAEEMLFRGILYPAIKNRGYPGVAMWVSAFLFALMHANLMIFLPLLALAVILTLLYERTNNLMAPIAAHSLFNALNFIRLCLDERAGGIN
jgi:membrane protease YdiL (CAAX protease family)